MVRALLARRRVDFGRRFDELRLTPLMMACHKLPLGPEFEEVLDALLLADGVRARIDDRNANGQSALDIAVSRKHAEGARKVLAVYEKMGMPKPESAAAVSALLSSDSDGL